jgi:hypothetical protein
MTAPPSMANPPFSCPLNENEIQRAVFDHIKARAVPNVFAFHPKNGGVHQRGRRAGINSGLGVVSGVPDIIILARGQVYALELKTDRGKVSTEQHSAMARMKQAGAIVSVAHGLDAAIEWLEGHGILKGRAA